MPLNPAERQQVATAMLRCFGEDSQNCGRTLKFLAQFTAGQVDLLADVSTLALTWQPFIDAGMDLASRQWWAGEMTRVYNGTVTT